MSPDSGLQQRIYEALKADIRRGILTSGQHIDLQTVSDRHRASVTPVREALWRLVGEGLAEAARTGGFRLSSYDGSSLRDLYGCRGVLLAHALSISSEEALGIALGSVAGPREHANPAEVANIISSLFERIAGASGNQEIQRAVAGSNDRLSSARIAEVTVMTDIRREILNFKDWPQGKLKGTLARRVAIFHRKRIKQSVAIAVHAKLLSAFSSD